MPSKMNEFREFVKKIPLIRDEVNSGSKTWQMIYEEWVIYGEEDSKWDKYKTVEKKETKDNRDTSLNFQNVKKVFEYAKNINPDNLNKTLNNVQKVIQIAQTVSGNKSISAPVASASAFSDWWD